MKKELLLGMLLCSGCLYAMSGYEEEYLFAQEGLQGGEQEAVPVEEPVEFMEEEEGEVVLGAPAASKPLDLVKPAPSDHLLLLQARAQEMGQDLKSKVANVDSLTLAELQDLLLAIKAMGTALTQQAEMEDRMPMIREDLQVLRDGALVLQAQRKVRAPAVVRAPLSRPGRPSSYEQFGPHGGGWAPNRRMSTGSDRRGVRARSRRGR